LEALKNLYLGRFRLLYILSREVIGEEIYQGRINKEKCQALGKHLIQFESYDEAFICGPEQMIHDVKDHLTEIDFNPENIRFELFTSPGQAKAEDSSREVQDATEKEGSDITVILDGVNYAFKLPKDGMNILDAANQVGGDLPFACKGGVCCTCRAKVVEGEVSMDVNYALEADELEQGFVLTCQAHPKTEKVVVNFDII